MKTKKIKLRKSLAMLLSLCMVLAMFPMSALAADEGTEGPMPEPVGGVITLTEDIVLAATYTVSEATVLTIDLKGHTITNAAGQHTIVNNGTLTIRDSSEGKTGVVDNVSHGKGALVNNRTATLESGKLTRSAEAGTSATENGGNSWYVVDNHGTLTVTGGNIINDSGYSSLIRNVGTMNVSGGEMENTFIAIKNDEAGTEKQGVLNVTGGTIISENQAIQNWCTATISDAATITGDIGTWAYEYNDDIFAGQTTVSGGNIDGDIYISIYESYPLGANPETTPKVTINGGTIDGNVTNDAAHGTIEITGGTYTADPSVYVADGYIVTGVEGAFVVEEATEGPMPEPVNNVITLTKNVALTEVYTVPTETELTIDLAGHKITNATSQHTIVNNGTLTIRDSSEGKTGVVDNVSHGKGALVNNRTATLESGKLTRSAEAGTSATENGGNSWYVVDNHGTLTVTGGNIINDSGYSSLIRNVGEMNVSGGEMENTFIAIKNDEAGTEKQGVLNVTGGTITSQNQAIQNWSTATISDDATITGDIGTWAYKSGSDIFAGDTTISGGSIDGDIVVSIYNVLGENPSSVPSVTISSGIVTGKVTATTPGTIEITGGTYTVNPSAYVADGYIVTGVEGAFVVKEAIKVTFDLSYEDATGTPDVATADENGKIALPENPAREGYGFGGWYLKEADALNTKVTTDLVFTEDTTVYAKWVKVEAPAKPAATVDSALEEDETATALAEAIGNSDSVVAEESTGILSSAAADTAPEPDDGAAEQALEDAGVEVVGENDLLYYTQQPYLDITIAGLDTAETAANVLTLQIKAMSQTVVSTDENDFDTTKEEELKAATVGAPRQLTVNDSVTVTLPLTDAVYTALSALDSIYVRHVKDDGRIYYYEATLSGDEGSRTLTFTSVYGFSTFTLTGENTTVAKIDDRSFDSLQDAVNAVTNNGTISMVKDGSATVSKVITFQVNTNGKTANITAGGNYRLTSNTSEGTTTYTVTAYSGGGGGGGGSTTPTTPTDPTTPEKEPAPPIVAPDAPAKMTDTAGHWGKEAIDYVISRGLFAGTSETTFSPNTQMTRAMVWTVLARLDGQDTSGGANWYAQAQTWATANDISDGTLPQGNVTREQLIAILYRYSGSPAASQNLNSFGDAGQISSWASDAMQWAVENGLIVGSNNALNPQGDATRAEVSMILMRYIQLTRI